MRNLLIILLLLVTSVSGCAVAPVIVEPEPIQLTDNLTVYFFDVGQGDCELIDYGDYECLIDAGDIGTPAATMIAPYVQGPLEDVIASHSHADHIGGFPGVFAQYEVLNYWRNSDLSTSDIFHTVSVASIEATIHVAQQGDLIHSGELTIKVLQSDVGLTPNNKSVVVEVIFGSSSFLFTGDIEAATEPSVPNVGVLKVSHHGACTSTSSKFLEVAHPKVAIYSAGVGNSYGHPCAATLDRLTAVGAVIYGTDKNGTIRVTTDGTDGVTVERSK